MTSNDVAHRRTKKGPKQPMIDWLLHSRWHELRVDRDSFASLLDTTPDWIDHQLAHGCPDIPTPADQRHGPRWTEHQVFTTVLTLHGEYGNRVPRLFPTDKRQQSARFLTTGRVDIDDGSYGARGPFALHYWQPADDRGVVAIAYPSSYVNSVNPDKAAAELLSRVDASAVVVPCGMSDPLPNGAIGDRQPVVGVADHSTAVLSAGRWRWFDVTALLCTDIPWWPTGLTDIDAILAWRPGDPPRRLQVTDEGACASWLTRASLHAQDPTTRQAFDTIASWVDYRICEAARLTPDGCDDTPQRPGLTRAAIAEIPARHGEYGPREVSTVLHHIVGDPTTAYWAVRTGLMYGAWWPVAGFYILVIDRDELSRLGHEWCNRLVPVSAERHNELGFAILWSIIDAKQGAAQQWWTDPRNPDMWAISDDTGRLFATIGTRVPAYGQLNEVSAGHALTASRGEQLIFFRDSRGDAWPLPTTQLCHYCPGVEGDHAERLANSLAVLADDATADTQQQHDNIGQTELARYIAATPAPFTLTREQIQAMR